MEITPALATLLVAIAGPIGVTLGWWLGKRSERDRMAREERKSAYVTFVTTSMNYRNADDSERRRIRNERWEALAVLMLVAPPGVVRSAGYLVATMDRLLDPDVDTAGRNAIYAEGWEYVNQFLRLARADLKVGEADAFATLTPIKGERLTFERAAATASASQDQTG